MTCISWHNRIALLDMVYVSFSLQFCGAQTLPWVCHVYLSRSHHCSQSRGMYVLLMYKVWSFLLFSFSFFLSVHSILFYFPFIILLDHHLTLLFMLDVLLWSPQFIFYSTVSSVAHPSLASSFLHGKPFIFGWVSQYGSRSHRHTHLFLFLTSLLLLSPAFLLYKRRL